MYTRRLVRYIYADDVWRLSHFTFCKSNRNFWSCYIIVMYIIYLKSLYWVFLFIYICISSLYLNAMHTFYWDGLVVFLFKINSTCRSTYKMYIIYVLAFQFSLTFGKYGGCLFSWLFQILRQRRYFFYPGFKYVLEMKEIGYFPGIDIDFALNKIHDTVHVFLMFDHWALPQFHSFLHKCNIHEFFSVEK